MNKEKDKLSWVILACLICIALCFLFYLVTDTLRSGKDHVEVGFVLVGDESAPYSANFIRAVEALELQYGEQVSVTVKSNVPYEDTELVLRGLCADGCDIIFTNSYGYGTVAKRVASDYPDVQFCQATGDNANEEPVVKNYHTFMGEIYEGRYVEGLVAGLKMQELIDTGQISADDAWIGFVGAYPNAEVISGYTAFLLGVRETCPTARMRVKYAYTWASYMLERQIASEFIAEGCVMISQDSDTIGPAVECESAKAGHPVYHISYNQDMIDVAPTTSLIGTRFDWSPYICDAVGAVLRDKRIESVVSGHVHGNDVGAGFSEGWVKMLELNRAIAPEGSEELIEQAIADIEAGRCHVFQGDYIGVDVVDPNDVWDLRTEYHENADASAPSFHYILQDVIVFE